MPYIYALRNRTTDLVYYGSTTRDLNTRLIEHRNEKKQITSNQITSCPTAYIELVEEVSEEDRLVRERWWIENNPCVNERLPTQTPAEWYQANLEKQRANHREYYHANKEQILAKTRARRANSRRRLPSREPPLDAV